MKLSPKGQRRLRTKCRNGHPIENCRVTPKGYLRCRECEREGRNRYYNSHKDKRSVVNAMNDRRLRHEKRKNILAFLGGKCVRCDLSDWRILQIDHINGGGTREANEFTVTQRYGMIKEHPERYQILCANCNAIKVVENGEKKKKY